MSGELWVALVVGVLGSGGTKFIYDIVKDWKNRPTGDQKSISNIEQSIVTVARARDELIEDNAQIRATLAEERKRWDEERCRYENERQAWFAERRNIQSEISQERASWQQERHVLQDEISSLEKQLRIERAESERRYDSMLSQLAQISARTAALPEYTLEGQRVEGTESEDR